MPDTTGRIRLDVETATLQQAKQYVKELKTELLGLGLATAPAQELRQEMGRVTDAIDQASGGFGAMRTQVLINNAAITEATAANMGLTDVIKAQRGEHRTTMFAVREGTAAIESFTGKNKEMSSAINDATGSAMGMNFALSAMGGVFAEFALPVAIIIGVFSLLKKAIDGDTEALDNLYKKQAELKNKEREKTTSLEDQLKFVENQILWSQKTLKSMTDEAIFQATISGNVEHGKAHMVTTPDMVKEQNALLELEDKRREINEKITEEKKKQSAADKKDISQEARDAKKDLDDWLAGVKFRASQTSIVDLSNSRATGGMHLMFPATQSARQMGLMFPNQKTNPFEDPEGLLHGGNIEGVSVPEGPIPSKVLNDWANNMEKETEEFREKMRGLQELTQPLADGFNAVGNAIEQGMNKALGTATSLFQTFEFAVLDGLVKMIAKFTEMALVAGIFSLITGGKTSFVSAFTGLGGGGILGILGIKPDGASPIPVNTPMGFGGNITLINQLGNRSTDMVIYDSLGRMTAHRIL